MGINFGDGFHYWVYHIDAHPGLINLLSAGIGGTICIECWKPNAMNHLRMVAIAPISGDLGMVCCWVYHAPGRR